MFKLCTLFPRQNGQNIYLIATSDQNDQNLNPILEQGGQNPFPILDHKDNQSIF